MKYIKRMYYLVVLMGLMGIYNNASMPEVPMLGSGEFNSLKDFLQISHKKDGENSSLNSVIVQSSEFQNKTSPVLIEKVNLNKSGITSPAVTTVTTKKDNRRKNRESGEVAANYDPKTGLYEINGKPYVYLKSAYRPYKEKNIYYIDGVYYSYVPKPMRRAEASPALDRVSRFNDESNQKEVRHQLREKATDPNFAPQPGGILNADNFRILSTELAKAKKNMEYKKQALDQLLNE